jgi:hypothetical protein
MVPHESPAALFEPIVSLARVMKNTIDLRTGTGKDEMMNYFSEWSELKAGRIPGDAERVCPDSITTITTSIVTFRRSSNLCA